MAGLWDIILPAATTNVISNPSFELGITGWTPSGSATFQQDSTARLFGYSCGHWYPDSPVNDPLYFGTVTAGLTTKAFVWSLYVKAPLGNPYRLYIGSTAGAVVSTPTTFTGTGDWQRITHTWQESTFATNRRLYLSKNNSANTGEVLIDGAQCEIIDATALPTAAATTYCDGSRPGCSWQGQAHASMSLRSSQSAAGGVVTNLDSLNVYVKDWPGAGMIQVNNLSTQLAMQDGAVFQRTLAKPRTFTLQLTAYNPNGAGSLAGLHSIRKAFIDAIKPDRIGQQQPFILQYRGGGSKTIRIAAFYDAGLDWGERKGFTEEIGLRCIAYDPYWTSEYDNGAALTAVISTASANRILLRTSAGVWGLMGTALAGGSPNCAYQAPDSSVYVGGDFTTAGGTTANRIAKWALATGFAGGSWSVMGSPAGVAGGTPLVWSLCGDGTASGVYALGTFTTAGGVTVNNIARWNGSAWSALGTTPGTNGLVYDGVYHPNGLLYVVGNFTTAGGGAAAGFASYNLATNTWAALGVGLTGGAGRAITLGTDGKLYISGIFASPFANNVVYDPTTGGYSAMASGPQGTAGNLATLVDGTIVNGASFTDPISVSSVTGAQWNGAAWSRLEPYTANAGATVRRIESNPAARGVFMAGTMAALPGIGVALYAQWNGSSYTIIDASLSGANGTMILPLTDGGLVVGFDTASTSLSSGITSVTNGGTSAAQPRISVTGPGQLYSITNVTSGDVLYFNNLTLQTGETLVIDLRTGVKSFLSNFRNCLSYVAPGSNIATFRLLPGVNSISVFVANASATASIVWTERYWSIDGGAA